MGPALDEGMRSFLGERLGNYERVEPLAGDASARAYWRVRGRGGPWVLCFDRGFIGAAPETYPFVVVYHLLKGRVPVPGILTMDAGRGLFLMEDLGDDLLESLFPSMTEQRVKRIYSDCVESLFAIQTTRGEGLPFSLGFDAVKLMYEFDFFIEHALEGHFGIPADDDMIPSLRREFLKIAELLDRPGYFVLNHRDYHSRNIIIHRGVPHVIDYQDARMGLPQYDLVSLIRDSYVRLDESLFEWLKDLYYEGSRDRGIHSMGRDEFDWYFDLMAFQRNVKAMGTFGYQSARMGNQRYERYIAPTADYLEGYAGCRNELARAWELLEPLLRKR
ncbi:MAG: phosphotransferase [Spirochaetes bacterium]|nr:phosphotransferase [Spirochaetota bacterium]